MLLANSDIQEIDRQVIKMPAQWAGIFTQKNITKSNLTNNNDNKNNNTTAHTQLRAR